MKVVITLLSILIAVPSISAQTNYIIAGQTENMIFSDFIPDYSIPIQYEIGGCGLPNHSRGTLGLDINKDGTNDLTIVVDQCSSLGGGTFEISFVTSTATYVYAVFDTTQIHQGTYGSCDTLHQFVAKKFSERDTLFDSINVNWQSGEVLVASYFSLTGGLTCNLSDRTPIDTPYYFIKIISGGDTSLGFVHFRNELLDYACQGPESTFIISSLEEIKDQRDVLIYPVPFTDYLIVESPFPLGYQIINTTGKIMLYGTYESQINTESLCAGYYLIKLRSENDYITKPLIKISR